MYECAYRFFIITLFYTYFVFLCLINIQFLIMTTFRCFYIKIERQINIIFYFNPFYFLFSIFSINFKYLYINILIKHIKIKIILLKNIFKISNV